MKRFAFWFAVLLSVVVLSARAAGPDDDYVRIYGVIQEADQLAATGQKELARSKYQEAEAELKQFRTAHPGWNEKVVTFRINYVAEKLGKLGAPARPAETPGTSSRQAPVSRPVRDTRPQVEEKDAQIQALTARVQELESTRGILEAKLKEALSAQPAAVDPRELAKAEEKIRTLEKEKELLRIALDQEQAKTRTAGTSALDDLKKALAETTQRLKEQADIAQALAREKEILEARLQSARQNEQLVQTLRTENEALKKQLASAKPTPGTPTPGATPNTAEWELTAAKASSATNAAAVASLQSQLKALQEEKAALEKSKRDLETRLASLTAAPGAPAAESGRIKQLEAERDGLLKKLNETTRQLYDNKARSEKVQRTQQENQMEILRARLEVFEARKIPYTPEELALFKQPETGVAKVEAKAPKRSARPWPKGAEPLLREAERAFAMRRYDEVERKYAEVLKLDEKNVFTLANLAAVQIEQKRFDEAEANLKRALELEPDDAYSLSRLGILKFRQEKYDEALDALSRAARLDPSDHEIQNYLGITLSQKGQRGPAETALRKAIQLAPGYGGAHYNLAVVYATQQPPFTELARYHYQKAVAAGHPQNLELEKIIEGAPGSGGGK